MSTCNTTKMSVYIPIVGKITAGAPILSMENIQDTFILPLDFIKHDRELFMLKIIGESMINLGIKDGDYVVIEKIDSVTNEDIVVALIENKATLKRFYKERNHIRLQPENDTMDPIIVDDCSVLGKVVGLYRDY